MSRPNHIRLASDIHQSNIDAGWWTDLATGKRLDRNFGEMIALAHSELSECWGGLASSAWDDHIPDFLNWHVELADACIRAYDMLGGAFSAPLSFIPFKLDQPEGFSDYEDRLVFLHALLSHALEHYRKSRTNECQMYLWRFLDACFEFADEEGFSLLSTICAKWEYNKTRADHKIENRLKDDGKKI